MARKIYVGSSNGIKPNTTSGYINTGYILDPTKTVSIEIYCLFTDVATYTTVMRFTL